MVIAETSSKIPKWKTLFSCILPTVTKNWEFTGIEDLLWVRWLIAFPTKTSALQRHNCYNPFPLGSGEWPSCSVALSLKTQGHEMSDEIKVDLYTTFQLPLLSLMVLKYNKRINIIIFEHETTAVSSVDGHERHQSVQTDSCTAETHSFFGSWGKKRHV